jgi:hypothetical protein
VEVGSGLLGRVDGTAHDHEVVDVLAEGSSDAGGHLGCDARPRCELVAGQPQADDCSTRAGAHGLDDLPGEQQALLAPFVAALVGEAGQELADQAVLAGIDLDPVATGLHRQRGGRAETGDDRGDVVGLHPLRHFARVDLRHPRGCPQFALVVGAGALAAGMVERGDHQRSMCVAGGADGRPAVCRTIGQRRTFVRPVAVVHAGAFGDDDAASTAGAALEVGGVARREAALVVAEVGDVWPEHDPISCGRVCERQRLQQLHGQLRTSRNTGMSRSPAFT